jgi:hypothetical protein
MPLSRLNSWRYYVETIFIEDRSLKYETLIDQTVHLTYTVVLFIIL